MALRTPARPAMIVAACFAGLLGSAGPARARSQNGAGGTSALEPIGHVDSLHGSFQTGIPIEVPTFRGLTPELALGYDSQAGNGPLGVGWSVSGFQMIQRG